MTTVVLGLDGGGFELIGPWIEEGALPNLSKLVQDGVAGDMQSCLPPVTCPNWQCYATGTNPGKLGVFWWDAVDRDEGRIENRSAAGDFEGEYYWRQLDGPCAIINLPTSHPPSKINGMHIAGGPGAEQTGFTYPSSLETTLKEDYNYSVHPEKMSLLAGDDPDNECIDEIYELIQSRFDVLENELEKGEYELIHITVFYLNVLQHFYWDMEVVKKAWEIIDKRLGDIFVKDEVDTFFVMSDHGSNEIQTTFRINTWLEENGYLYTNYSISDYLHRFGITQERIRPVLANMGIEWWVRRLLSERVQMYLPDSEGSVKKSAKGEVIDWDKSQAVASGQGPVYVLSNESDEREQIVSDLISDLENITDRSDNPVFDQVLRANDIYEGEYLESGPDIVLDQAPGVHIEGKIGGDSVFGSPSKWRGENKDTGMFIGYGGEINASVDLSDMHILDLAPTILHLHGKKIPERMGGEVRLDLFGPDSEPKSRSITRSEIDNIDSGNNKSVSRDVNERLADLGYME